MSQSPIPIPGLEAKRLSLFVQGTVEDTGTAGERGVWPGNLSSDWQDFGAVTGVALFASSSESADQAKTFEVVGLDADDKLIRKEFTLDGADGQTQISIPSGAVAGDGWNQILDVLWTDVNGDHAGDIFVYSVTGNTAGVPNTLTSIRGKIVIGNQRGRMAVFQVPTGFTARIVRWFGAAEGDRLRLKISRLGLALGFETVDEQLGSSGLGAFDRGLPKDTRFEFSPPGKVKVTVESAGTNEVATGGFVIELTKDD